MAVEALPRRWGEGLLFAFSGVDGPSGPQALIATALRDRLGFAFPWPGDRELWCESRARLQIHPQVVASDWVEFSCQPASAPPVRLTYLALDACTVVGETSALLPPRSASRAAATTEVEGCVAHVDAAGATLLATAPAGDRRRFAFVYASSDVRALVSRARAALTVDVEMLREAKRAWLARAAGRPRAELLAKALAVMKVNACTPTGRIRHCWTTPDRWPHRYLWLWNSAFHAGGWRHIDPAWASEMLLAVLDHQRDDGFIPHCIQPDGDSTITQPPVLAWAVERLFEVTEDRSFLREVYPRLVAFAEWVRENRPFADEFGLYTWAHAAESGMERSPRFDQGAGFAAADLASYLARDYEALARLANILDRREDADRWRARHREIFEGTNYHLWHDDLGLYLDGDWDGTQRREPVTIASCLPLYAGLAPPSRAARLLERLRDPDQFWTPLPLPSVDRRDPAYAPEVGRGPVWLHLNLLIYEGLRRHGEEGLAAELKERSLAAVEAWYRRTGCLWECYDPDDVISPRDLDRKAHPARGRGGTNVADYHGTAAVVAEWLMG
ncbi:MAG: hypothetical protein HY320_10865 [Armatimonadetes bacterium]|nr:hypothetical protein [Armatimonadota bacterium]